MSEEIFELATMFNDVAELGQGYVDRADGERILLSLPREIEAGEAVRFIVHLVDGTPAFAGAGRCVQVSDQGDEVAPAERYETLLDSLAFDERSRPVYDYIVAVRQMAYAAEAESGDAASSEEAVYDTGTSISAWPEASPTEEMSQLPQEVPADAQLTSEYPTVERSATPTDPSPEPDAEQDSTVSIAPDLLASVLPQPLPTGMLTRPAIAAHWAPMAPRPPRPSSRPSRFRYAAGALPAPPEPPRPNLHESQWVQPAIRP